MRPMAWITAALLGACPAPLGAQTPQPADPTPPRIEWLEDEGSSVGLSLDGQTLWRLDYDEALTHIAFHPLALPGVGPLTADAPPDHVHHHGLWFSWKFINGVNFWENAPGSDRPAGRTAWDTPGVVRADDASAAFRFNLRYLCADEVVLAELREITVAAPGPEGSYAIDWASWFTVQADQVALDRTPLPDEPGGKAYGGYAGLSARLVQMDDRQAMTTDGPVEFNDQDRYRARHDAFEYSGAIDGKEVGIAILSHPENANSPSPWYAIRSADMSFFTPAVICYEPLTLRKGEVFPLRYRVVVHPGRWGREELAAAFEAYAGVPQAGQVGQAEQAEQAEQTKEKE
ncbi:MAG: PmoA family protein [Phycisphaerales bacterium]|nr:PmoA family protein [Phycisphaerales bacterium]